MSETETEKRADVAAPERRERALADAAEPGWADKIHRYREVLRKNLSIGALEQIENAFNAHGVAAWENTTPDKTARALSELAQIATDMANAAGQAQPEGLAVNLPQPLTSEQWEAAQAARPQSPASTSDQ